MAKSLNQLCNLAVQNMTTFVNRSILCQIAPNVIENFQSLRREGPKSPFCLPSLLPLRCIGSRWNPVIIKLKDPLYPLRYHLSRLIQGIGSYLKTTTGCRTRYLKSSGLQSSQIFQRGSSYQKLDFSVNCEKCREKSDYQSNAWQISSVT